ncbi:MAG: Crp/Fnr family transcriptional regulator [Bacteroidota bacterium]
MKEYQAFVKRILEKYSPVGDASVLELLSIARVQHLKKGETLLDIGKVSREIHMLYEGAIVSYFINSNGDVYHKNIFLKEDWVGSTVSALKETPSEFALEVIEDATLISFDHRKYQELITKQVDLKNFYIAYLEKNWVVDKERREIDIVLKDADERYLDYIKAHPKIETRIPLHYIASHLGITPTQLSRIRKKIKKNTPNQHM